MPFLPDDYEEPTNPGKYLEKISEWKTKLRFLTAPIMGWEWWTEQDGKRVPHRVRDQKDIPKEVFADKENQPKFFWKLVVYDYQDEQVKIMSITQKSIREAIQSFLSEVDYADPTKYDIIITRTGKSKNDTKYAVTLLPPKELAVDVSASLATIDLNVLFDGGDPFNDESGEQIVGIEEFQN